MQIIIGKRRKPIELNFQTSVHIKNKNKLEIRATNEKLIIDGIIFSAEEINVLSQWFDKWKIEFTPK